MNNLNNSNFQKNQPEYHYMNNPLSFNLGQINKIKPKLLKKLDIINLVRTNNIPELKQVLYDLSQENFAENDYFEFQKNELKLIKTYQILMQYMMNSINQLEEKNQKLSEFIHTQLDYNEAGEAVLEKQNRKIKNQEEDINKIVDNCVNMEFLVKKLGLEDRIKELGLEPISKNNMSDKDFENFAKKVNNNNNINNNNNAGEGGED